ncbi:hypothetical protein BU23DRAFT_588901 [Bimuria novae-zelandiae CBS 107.79]|uniref:Uncharacterized protein n=1 Tax=Bimuria novae-zelandiae CBS 107.79 TaxID=1447943 RepID=A0A6A5VEP0_9PLEO|nr:hypothetical protein BU23DRAFT_588901 [Bimuria novae-zelandiae CBS 107.79]
MASIISDTGAIVPKDTSMQRPTGNGFVFVVAKQSHGHETTTPSPCETIDLNNKIPDRFHQLPELPNSLPKKHKQFVHSLPPRPPIYRKFSVFLAGSIEMGKAVQWQTRMADELSPYPITVNNPRRPEWNNDEESMRQQVEWELSALEQADSPVTLWELGKYTDSGKVVLSCKRYGVPFVETFADLPGATVKMLKEKGMGLDANGDLVGDNTHVPKPKPKPKLELERENKAMKSQIADLQAKLAEAGI